jgi:hypothetical protein
MRPGPGTRRSGQAAEQRRWQKGIGAKGSRGIGAVLRQRSNRGVQDPATAEQPTPAEQPTLAEPAEQVDQ